jgi:hypothetical protein
MRRENESLPVRGEDRELMIIKISPVWGSLVESLNVFRVWVLAFGLVMDR